MELNYLEFDNEQVAWQWQGEPISVIAGDYDCEACPDGLLVWIDGKDFVILRRGDWLVRGSGYMEYYKISEQDMDRCAYNYWDVLEFVTSAG